MDFGNLLIGVSTKLAGGGTAGGVNTGFDDNVGNLALFASPNGVAFSISDTVGTVYVADADNNRIRMITVPTG